MISFYLILSVFWLIARDVELRLRQLSAEMPLFRKFPEIRKFQIERKNFRKNETVSLDKIIDQKRGEKVLEKGKCIKIHLLKSKMAIYSILYCSVIYFKAVIFSKLMRRL